MPSKRALNSPLTAPAGAHHATMACACAGVLLAAAGFVAWHGWSRPARSACGVATGLVASAPDLSPYLLCGVALVMLPAVANGRSRSTDADRMRHRLWMNLAARPLSAARMLLTLGILAQSLAPFDFVSDTDHLHAGLRRTAWLFIPGVLSGSVEQLTWTRAAEVILAPDVIVFGVLGFLAVCAGRERGLPRRRARSDAGRQILILAAVAGTVEMFVVTRHLALATIVVKGLAGMVGARLAAAIPESLRRFPFVPVRPRSPSGRG